MKGTAPLSLLLVLCALGSSGLAQTVANRDEFFWLGQMNKASAAINAEDGLLDPAKSANITAGTAKVLDNASRPGASRPSSVIRFEPLLIRAAGQDVTLNDARSDASTALALGIGPLMRVHNITPGMSDAKDVRLNSKMVKGTVKFFQGWDRILNALVISPERALEELNSDWTASQELADLLMRQYKLPIRVGHHFVSNVVDFVKINNIKLLDFPCAQARRIYAESVKEAGLVGELPMSESEFRAALDPVAIVEHRVPSGVPSLPK